MNFLLADDHSIVRMGLRLLIEEAYPGALITEAENGSAVMEMGKHTKYDLIILDFQMPDTEIFNVISYLLARDSEAKILVFTMASGKLYAPKLFAAGVKGFLSKEAENCDVLHAIKNILEGKLYHCDGFVAAGVSGQINDDNTSPFSLLSTKEMDILHYLIQGKHTKEISTLSHLQMSTISTHKVRIFRKLNVSNMVELFALAREHQLQ